MAKETFRVAVASSDGIVVNSHFGRAGQFLIYEVSEDDGSARQIESRKLTPVCAGGDHDDGKLRENLEKLRDCQYLLVSRIGNGAAMMAESLGMIPMELAGEISESITELVKYRKIQNLFAG